MRYIAELKKIQGFNAVFKMLEKVNLDRLRTLFGSLDNVEATIIFKDKRKLSDRQRKFYRALLNDVYKWSGQGTDELHEIFKEEYFCEFNHRISTAEDSLNSKSDMNNLIELVIGFMFEFNVPFAKGYELLPTNESYYLYLCIKRRKCVVCGAHADIHHIDAVGNRKRTVVDHSKLRMIALCRKHHNEAHSMGNTNFCNKYRVQGIKVDYEALINLGLMNKKQVTNIKEETYD